MGGAGFPLWTGSVREKDERAGVQRNGRIRGRYGNKLQKRCLLCSLYFFSKEYLERVGAG